MDTAIQNKSVVIELAYMGCSLLGSFLILRWALTRNDNSLRAKTRAQKKEIAKRWGRKIELENEFEQMVAREITNPDNIDCTLSDIGGLDEIIEDLQRNVITPMLQPKHFRTSLLRQKRGVLLYGPPGTGKTMLAKALAKESHACFIVIKASTILSKWYGETNKMISAIWTLAYKLQPTILFIDEVDALLGSRNSSEHEATTAMKTEFMQLWEGFETDPESNVVVLGATNKKYSLDDAVLRRFSLQYEVGLPTVSQREQILRSILKKYSMEDGAHGIDSELLDSIYADAISNGDGKNTKSNRSKKSHPLRDIAEKTEGFSGSDLKELASQAASIPVHKYLSEMYAGAGNGGATGQDGSSSASQPGPDPLAKVHFEQVLEHMVPPSRAAQMAAARKNLNNGNARQASREALMMSLEPLIESLAR
jgi:SpoVK/Ycf46/Vps4 family AAA+-type ATPase